MAYDSKYKLCLLFIKLRLLRLHNLLIKNVHQLIRQGSSHSTNKKTVETAYQNGSGDKKHTVYFKFYGKSMHEAHNSINMKNV